MAKIVPVERSSRSPAVPIMPPAGTAPGVAVIANPSTLPARSTRRTPSTVPPAFPALVSIRSMVPATLTTCGDA